MGFQIKFGWTTLVYFIKLKPFNNSIIERKSKPPLVKKIPNAVFDHSENNMFW